MAPCAMARINELSILRLLLEAPMTVGWILHASASFPRPYRSQGRVREVMAGLHGRGLVRRVPMAELHQGQRRWLYCLAPAARRLLPELADLRPGSGAFRPPADPRAHALAVAELVAHMHRAAGEAGPRARLLEGLRDGAFRADVDLPGAGARSRQVVPDHTFLVEVDGRPQLLLLELQNRGAVILPASPRTLARSFRFKLAKHKAFLSGFRSHPLVARMIAAHGPLAGFRVLVVTTRTEASMLHLLSAASGYAKLFYFTTMGRARSGSLLLDPIWRLPNGQVRAVADPP